MSCYFTLFYCLLDLSCGERNVISLYFPCCPVHGSVCLVCCVFVNCLVKQFAIYLRVVVILLLLLLSSIYIAQNSQINVLYMNVMEVLRVGGGALLDRPCMVFQRMCVLCL